LPSFIAVLVLIALVAPAAWSAPPAPSIRSSAAVVVDDESGSVLFAKNPSSVQPIASITKLMTAIIVIDAQLDLQESIKIIEQDTSSIKWSSSRLRIGAVVTRDDLLRLALMASENRAASALARTYPGGEEAAIAAMNEKAIRMGLSSTRFDDPTGLSSGNVSTATELARLVQYARRYPIVSEYSTLHEHTIKTRFGPTLFANTNRLVRANSWNIDLSKTGFIAEAGRCLVMHLNVAAKPMTFVFLDAAGRLTPFADANRVRAWLDSGHNAPRNSAAARPIANQGALN
jgi:serine-type D-Ala-D-Ala endopeptidase (penicillin-binding protein 7)